MHRDKFLIIKPTRCTNFSNLFLKWNSTCFGQFLCPSSTVIHCTHSDGICHTGLLTAVEQDQDGTSWSCSQAASKPVWRIPLLCEQWKTPDDGQRNCQKHVEFHFKNKFEKLVHLVGFIIRNPICYFLVYTGSDLGHSRWKGMGWAFMMCPVPLLIQNTLLLTHTCYETWKIWFHKLEISIQNERYFMYSFLRIMPNVFSLMMNY